MSGQHSDISAAFIKWYNNTSDLPFFVWLEGHPICTQEGYLESARPVVSSVLYGPNNGIRRVFVSGNQLVACSWLGNQQPTALTTASGTLKSGEAFAWLTTGELLIHNHVVGSFHHSSFNGGRKVRCAGMMTVENGKVMRVDNNSGHYKPTTQHFLTFLKILDDKKVLAENARIATHDINDGRQESNLLGYPLDAFRKEVGKKV
ncbi:MAG: hypothetical protein HC808_06405 [Candidatus Competibacteraceae bacterium]|nr:hypothetical protein [Candidatus Competibacteraceae bacterium]